MTIKGFCIGCASGNDLLEGEQCQMCGRIGTPFHEKLRLARDDNREQLFKVTAMATQLNEENARLRAFNERLRAKLDKAMRIIGTSLHSDAATERIKLENDHLRAENERLREERKARPRD